MPIILAADPLTRDMHGSRFHSYVAPTRSGSTQLCAWRVEVTAGQRGVPHEVSHEEVLLVLSGTLVVTLGDERRTIGPGDVVQVPASTPFALDNLTTEPATAWVTTSVGLTATLPDGSRMSPPWTG